MRLIYLSAVPWKSFAQRPHKFVQWFHSRTGEQVLWIEPYPTRFLRLSDLGRLRTLPTPIPSVETPPWLTVLKPGGLPIEPFPGSGWVNKQLWRHVFEATGDFARNSKALLAIGKPSVLALALLKRFRRYPSLYDAMDDFPAFYTGFSRLALARRERLVVQQVDTIWASSTEIQKHWGLRCNDVRLVHNGLDLSVLPPLVSRTPTGSSEKKILGYVGTIAAWFDWDWVCALAQARPKDEIRLIGPVFEKPVKKLPDNIMLLPACSHDAALKAMLNFDVGLIPFKKNRLTDSVDPIKYYEYVALALPVLSTSFGEMRFRSNIPGVFISQSVSDSAELAEASLQFCRNIEYAHGFARGNSWEARFDGAKLFERAHET
jgi:hypothetical protein